VLTRLDSSHLAEALAGRTATIVMSLFSTRYPV